MENATNSALVAPIARRCWFVTDADYAAYDTLACVGQLKKAVSSGDMMTPEEILALQCNQGANMEGVARPSRRFFRTKKKQLK